MVKHRALKQGWAFLSLLALPALLHAQVPTPAISSIQSGFGTATNGAAITAGTPSPNASDLLLFINGNFSPDSFSETITWTENNTNTPLFQETVQATTTQLVVNVPMSLYQTAGTATITVTESQVECANICPPGNSAMATYTVNPVMAQVGVLPAGLIGVPYSQPFFTGGTGPFTVAFTTPPGPPGLGATATTGNPLFGTPTTTGTFQVQPGITDSWGNLLVPNGTETVTITRAITATTLAVTSDLDSPAATQVGRVVTITATTTSTGLTPTGTFSFTLPVGTYSNPQANCGVASANVFTVNGNPTAGSETAACTFTVTAPAGTNTYGVAYNGDAYTATSVNTAQITVIKDITTTALAVTADPDPTTATRIGQVVTITATTATQGGITTAPTGAFSFTLPVGTYSNPQANCGVASGNVFAATGVSSPGSATAACTFTITAPTGTNTYSVTYTGDANTAASTNPANSTQITVIKDVTTTALAVTTDADPTTGTQVGRVITLTATTTQAGTSSVPVGTFSFTLPVGTYSNPQANCGVASGNVFAATGVSSAGSATAACTFTITAPAGTNTYSVTYNGDANTGASTNPANSTQITVIKDVTTTALAVTTDADPTTATHVGRVVTLTATTTQAGTSSVPAGTFSFTLPVGTYSNPQANCGTAAGNVFTANGSASGATATATCTFTITAPAGTNTYSVTYNGDANTGASTNPANSTQITVVKDVTTTTLAVTADADPTTATQVGRTVTITATTATQGGLTTTPTGVFSFTLPVGTYSNPQANCGTASGNVFSANGTSSPGSATAACTFTITAPAGINTYTVTYNADANTGTSVNSTQIVVVKDVTTTVLAVTADPDPTSATRVGQVVTITATTTTQSGIAIAPAGTFSFTLPAGTYSNPQANCGVASANIFTATGISSAGSATATCTFTITTPAGTNTYGVTYNGDVNTATSANSTQIAVIFVPLKITTTGLPAGTVGQIYNTTVAVTGGLPPYRWSYTGLPGGLTFSASTGVISGTPLNSGTFSVNVQVSDNGGQNVPGTFSLLIKPPPPPPLQITTASLPGGTAGQIYGAGIGASGGTGDYVFSVSGGSLPSGVQLALAGQLYGTPASPGTFTFTVAVTDAAQDTAFRGFSIQILPAPVTVTGAPPATVTLNSSISTKFIAAGGVGPYTFTLSGSAPTGTTFSGGTLSGTATAQGTFNFTVTATDSETPAVSASQGFSITVTPASLALSASLPGGQLGQPYSGQINATGGVPPYTFTGSAGGGLTLSSSGSVSGTPTAQGSVPVSVTVTDHAGATASGNFSITIAGPGLMVSTTSLPNGALTAAYSAGLAATGGTPPYTFTATGLPDGLSVSSSGAITGTPTALGTFSVSVTVTDHTGLTATASLSITIGPAPLKITTTGISPATFGVSFSVGFGATGGTPPYTWTATGTPGGVAMSSTGTLSGTPTALGTFSLTVTVTDANGTSANESVNLVVNLPSAPTVSFTGLPATGTPGTQASSPITFNISYPVDVTVNLTLTFAPTSGADDPNIQFSTGGRTATLTVKAGSTTSLTTIGVQTGTVAGVITITAQLLASGTDITPTPPPTRTIVIGAGAPTISSVTATTNSTGVNVTIVGFDPTRSITQVTVTFTPAAGSTLQTTTFTISAQALFSAWYQSSASTQFGSQFSFTIPFTVTGNVSGIASVTVTLTNGSGTSAAVTATV